MVILKKQKNITKNEDVSELTEKDAEGILKEKEGMAGVLTPQWEKQLHAIVEQAHEKLEEEA